MVPRRAPLRRFDGELLRVAHAHVLTSSPASCSPCMATSGPRVARHARAAAVERARLAERGAAGAEHPCDFVLLAAIGGPALLAGVIAYGWLGQLFYLWTFFMRARCVAHSCRLVHTRTPAPPANPERRVFVSRVVAASAAAATIGIGAGGVRSALGEISKPEVRCDLRACPKRSTAIASCNSPMFTSVHCSAHASCAPSSMRPTACIRT